MQNPLLGPPASPVAGAAADEAGIGKLRELAMAGVLRMFNREAQLFCHRLRRSASGIVQEGISHRYTMMTLMGLHRCEESGMEPPVDVRQVLGGILEDTRWIDNIGDLGLLLWVCALVSPERLRDLERREDITGALSRYREAVEGRTTELAWFLSGLSHASTAGGDRAGLKESSVQAYQLLKKNQGDQGFFGHMARNGCLAGILRGHIGSFADQVYPIYALTEFGKAYGATAAIEAARSCAEAICRAQGSRGQWWWHYDARNGRIVERYPVYSVHQHGMAPMALFAVGEATQADFTRWIYAGLRWISETNEVGRDLREQADKLIWRSVYPASVSKRYLNRARTLLESGYEEEATEKPGIKWECRPYELGWLLYAFAGHRAEMVWEGPK